MGAIFHEGQEFGGALSTDMLMDVDGDITPADGDILVYNAAKGQYEPGGNLRWKTLRNDSGGSVVLPDNIKEFYCLAKFSTSGAYSQVGMFAANALIDGPTWHISNAYYVTFTRSTRSFTVTQVLNNTHNPAEKIIVYWR